jgi:hypothetical protein
MTDIVAIVGISISLITAIGAIVMGLHLKRCHSMCCDSECVPQPKPKTPPDTPILLDEPPIRQTIII